jgi:nicotinate-nucleotide pyrophosphorylase (carboxylating)
MLDNMDIATMKKAVEIASGKVLLEASGNISLENVREVALAGVDIISVGKLTHSAPSADIAMDIIE